MTDNNDDYWFKLPTGVWWGDHFLITQEDEAKCECGTKITLGKDDHATFHSDFCPVYKKWKEENGKSKA